MAAGIKNLSETRPYLSLTLVRVTVRPARIVTGLLTHIEEEFIHDPSRQRLARKKARVDELRIGYLQYKEEKRPAWLAYDSTSEVRDVLNHLVVVCRKADLLAIYASDPAVRQLIQRGLEKATGVFSNLEKLSRKVLSDAFLGAAAQTLWLSGIHRRTDTKADAKILSGTRLQSALNPLDDQTYQATASRQRVRLKRGDKYRPMGVSQRRSSVWMATCPNWPAFLSRTELVLDRVDKVSRKPLTRENPIPYVATPLVNASKLGKPFEVGLVPPELLQDDPAGLTDEDRTRAEKWAYRASFNVLPGAKSTAFRARVELDGEELAELNFSLEIGSSGRVSVAVEGKNVGEAYEFEDLLNAVRNEAWLKVRFDKGQALDQGELFSMRFRDFHFQAWRFVRLPELTGKERTAAQKRGRYDAKREKPTVVGRPTKLDLEGMGRRDSLFCWVVNNWFGKFASKRGWLACDDGGGEIADFVHLDLGRNPRPRVSLIHVKGSGHDRKSRKGPLGRGISATDYEVVCGQAVKNLRSLDERNLADRLRDGRGKDVAGATWEDGKRRSDRTGMIKALESLGSNYDRCVVVFQPRVTKRALEKDRPAVDAGRRTAAANRLRQLNALLLATESDCRDQGAEFVVLSAE